MFAWYGMLNLVLFSRMRSVEISNSPSKASVMDSNDVRNFELTLRVELVFKMTQDSFAASLMMTSTVSRIFCRQNGISLLVLRYKILHNTYNESMNHSVTL